ncbi:hypothetical protein GJ496_008869 [Pomphorhynchus laevis]|nr:hypothetical protein GJ496_008869 [Pomphorhynchus laevis]
MLDLQQHTDCNKRDACKGGNVEKEQTNAWGVTNSLEVDLSSTERYVKDRQNHFADREQCLIFANIAESSKHDAQGRLDEDVNAIRSHVSNLFATHEADLVKTLRVYSLFRLGNPKTCSNSRPRFLKAVFSSADNGREYSHFKRSILRRS